MGKNIYYSLGNFAFDNEDNSAYMPIGAVLSVNFDENKSNVESEFVQTVYEQGIVHIKENCNEYIHANNRLYSDKYQNIVQEYCENIFQQCFGNYIGLSIGLDLSNKAKMDSFFSYRKKDVPIRIDKPFIFHNTIVETNRWIIEHAIGSIR